MHAYAQLSWRSSLTAPASFSHEEYRFREAQVALLRYRELLEHTLEQTSRTGNIEAGVRTHFGGLGLREPMLSQVVVAYVNGRTQEVQITFPTMARYSLTVLIYSVLEEQGQLLCEALRTLKSLPLGWSDLKGDTLKKLHSYAVKLARLPAPTGSIWEDARTLEQIRHCIVHQNGDVARSQDATRLRQLVGKTPGYSVDDRGRISLGAESGSFLINAMARVFDNFFEHAGFPLSL